MLQRSLLGVCVKPIEFRKVMNRLLEEWNGPGSVESRNEALKDDLLLSLFDEVMMLWDFTSTLSRCVWVEIFGIPLNMWCELNIERIAELWGKVGPKVYSVESHSDRSEVISETADFDKSPTVSVESHMVAEASQVTAERRNLNLADVNDPQIDVLINEKSNYVHLLNMEREIFGYEKLERSAILKENETYRTQLMQNNQCGLLGYDTALFEAHLVFSCKGMGEKETVIILIGADGPKNRTIENGSHSDKSCPYPPGYGPCSNLGHVHHDGIREQELPFPSERDQREFGVGEGSPSDPTASASLGENSAVDDLCTDSDETRYLINQQAFIGTLVVDNDAKLDECELSSVLRQVCEVGEQVKENEFSGVPGIVVAFPTKEHINVDEATDGEGVLKGALSGDAVNL
ncbi:hypothetical protein PIB30_092382 [Stylosanthes scabra]|uniref:DUF4283 domain-containing protein n=1 Tax=Stylosanthes scabra TaxID=79078 RepID=A0ABU6SVD4_9FABA|nr:hypothetical protein [Stylosanthes scabra]